MDKFQELVDKYDVPPEIAEKFHSLVSDPKFVEGVMKKVIEKHCFGGCGLNMDTIKNCVDSDCDYWMAKNIEYNDSEYCRFNYWVQPLPFE